MQLQLVKTIRSQKFFFILAGLIYTAVFILNDGFMALDEYWIGVTRYIPAQSSSINHLVTIDDVKSPLQMLPMHSVAQLALKLGIQAPYWQYRFVILILGLLNICLIFYAFFKLSQLLKLNELQNRILQYSFLFYFAAPFALTRPMYEAIAAPWLTLAAVLAMRYDQDEKLSDLLYGVFFVSVAFVLRQQLGFCALVFIILTLMKKRYQHSLAAAGLGLFLLLISGIPDYYLRGQFHFSLLNLTVYNFQHGSEYGQRTILFYPFFIILMTFAPVFIVKYPRFWLKTTLRKQFSLWIVVILFVFLHSLFPQKWERFLISLIPILVMLIYPYLSFMLSDFKKYKVRLVSVFILNGVVFFIASFFPPQKNLIEMSLYLDQHPEIQKVVRFNNTPEWITEAFIYPKKFEFIEIAENKNPTEIQQQLSLINFSDCSTYLVVADHDLEKYKIILDQMKFKAEFNVNLIEQLAYKLNPKNNARRVKLNLFSGHCKT